MKQVSLAGSSARCIELITCIIDSLALSHQEDEDSGKNRDHNEAS